MSNKKIPLEEAQKIYDNYMEGFSGVRAYQERQKQYVMQHGYILLNPKTKYKAFIYDFDELKAIQDKFNGEF